jgi:hypothetical protein
MPSPKRARDLPVVACRRKLADFGGHNRSAPLRPEKRGSNNIGQDFLLSHTVPVVSPPKAKTDDRTSRKT